MDHGDPDVAAVVEQLAAEGLGEALDRVLGPAVRGLEGDGAVAEGGADLDDHAPVAGPHAGQRGERAVDLAQVGHAGDPGELGGRRLRDGGEDSRHGRVDPHVDGPQLVLRPLGGAVDGIGVGHVEREDEGPPPRRLHLLRRRLQPVASPGEEGDVGPPLGEGPHAGPTDARAGAGDDDHFGPPRPLHRRAPAIRTEKGCGGRSMGRFSWCFRSPSLYPAAAGATLAFPAPPLRCRRRPWPPARPGGPRAGGGPGRGRRGRGPEPTP